MQHTQRALTLVLVDETVQVCLEAGAQLRGRVGRRVRPIPVARLLAIEQLRLRPSNATCEYDSHDNLHCS